MTGIEALADLLVRIGADGSPADLLRHARRCLLDALGCAIHGAWLPEGRAALRAVRAMSADPTGTLGSADAALLGGFLCHLRELDDVHYAILHPGAVCVPAALAAAGRLDAPLGRVLWALVAGYEAMARVARGQNYLSHRKRGWHGTATCGAFGAAAAVAHLLQMDRTHLAWALGLAGSRTGGTWAFAADGAMSKRLHPGLAARDGVTAAYLARQGITGPLHVLEAEDGGFYRTTSDGWDLSGLTRGWGEEWAVGVTEFKWYAACKSAHAPIEAARRLYANLGGGESFAARVHEVRVQVNSTGHAMAGRGYRPDSVTSAQLSIPYGIAVALTGGSGDVADYTAEQVARPDRMRLARKVRVAASAEMDVLRATRHKVPGAVEIRFTDGSVAREYVEDPKGSRDNPLTDSQLADKFRGLTRQVAGEAADRIIHLVLEGAPDSPSTDLIAAVQQASNVRGAEAS
ncbi:MAG: MmgE/PrpD family protein [Candidatus Methylomirabilales bacterium]